MKKSRPPTLAAYDAVIEHVKAARERETGTRHGARTWLAKQLGMSRQALDNMSQRDGFPANRVADVSRIVGIPQKLIRPRTLSVETPEDAWDLLAPQELKDKSTIHNPRRK